MAYEFSVRLQKDYVDRGTQTEPEKPSVSSESDSPVSEEYSCLVISQPAAENFTSFMCESAYSRLQQPGISLPSVCQPSPQVSRPLRGHPLALYNRPLESHRVVSLPGKISPFKEQQSNETKLRIVSNPDYLRVPSSDFGPSSGADPYDDSGSTDACSIDQDRDWSYQHHPTRPCSPADIPRTPSPPSSPESITIIGNDSQVPESFLRRQQKYSICAYPDPNGWISWAKSPPKPIPALHGPSSLPYARCPSGAEGTVIDGEDLSHMIWGLDVSTSFSSSRRITSQGSFPPRLQKPQNSTLTTRRAEPIDIGSRPVALSHQFKIQERHPFSTASDGKSQENDQTYSTRYARPVQGHRPQHSPIDGTHEDNWRFGLGIQLGREGSLLEYPLQAANNTPKTKYPNSSAAIFVPTQSQQCFDPRVIIESRTKFRIDQVPHRLSALDVAQQYRAKQLLQNSLPTPPSSSSSQWNPVFLPAYVDAESLAVAAPLEQSVRIAQQVQSFAPQQKFYASDYTLHDPRLFSGRYDPSGIGIPDVALTATPGSDVPSSTQNNIPQAYEAQELLTLMSCLSPSPVTTPFASLSASPPRSARSIGSHLSRESNKNDLVLAPLSPDYRRNLSHQQPRSIPLARLIQRRLSSVTEEDLVRDQPSKEPPPRDACSALFSRSFKIRTAQNAGTSQDPIVTALTPQTQTDDLVESVSTPTSTQLVSNTNVTVKLPAKGTRVSSKFASNVGPEFRDTPTNESSVVTRKNAKFKKSRS